MKNVLDSHAHTIASGHAYNTIYEMAQTAADKGLELLALTEDHGGSSVIRRHQVDLALLEVDARELYDVDTVQALEELTRKQLAL